MNEYISKDKVLDDRNIITVQTKEYGSIEVIPVDTIADIELEDVQPVHHGKWRRIGRSRECTVCGEYCICNGDWSVLSAYCPTCGAKMDLE